MKVNRYALFSQLLPATCVLHGLRMYPSGHHMHDVSVEQRGSSRRASVCVGTINTDSRPYARPSSEPFDCFSPLIRQGAFPVRLEPRNRLLGNLADAGIWVIQPA